MNAFKDEHRSVLIEILRTSIQERLVKSSFFEAKSKLYSRKWVSRTNKINNTEKLLRHKTKPARKDFRSRRYRK